jgi:hypothetical protein
MIDVKDELGLGMAFFTETLFVTGFRTQPDFGLIKTGLHRGLEQDLALVRVPQS